MKLIHSTDRPELVQWAADHIDIMHGRSFPKESTAMGVEIDGKIAWVIVFHDYQPEYGTMQVSAAAVHPRWMRARWIFDEMFRYAWEVCGVQKLYSATPAKNRRALRFVMGLGFKPEAVMKRQFGDDDAVMSCFFKEWYYDQIRAGLSAAAEPAGAPIGQASSDAGSAFAAAEPAGADGADAADRPTGGLWRVAAR